VSFIQTKCRDRGIRAEIRRGLRRTPADAYTVTRHIAVAPYASKFVGHREKVAYAVASFTAAFSPEATASTLTFSRALTQLRHRGVSSASIDTRLMSYARASTDAMLYQHLPVILTHMKSHDINVDMGSLMNDLLWWPTSHGKTVKRWMQEYYRSAPKD
jgi:CRISPR type I-E-associated protein CasB/Cse2